jgi:hypothetical protein
MHTLFLMRTDLGIDEARTYRPNVPEPDGFDYFWAETLDEYSGVPQDLTARLGHVITRSPESCDTPPTTNPRYLSEPDGYRKAPPSDLQPL